MRWPYITFLLSFFLFLSCQEKKNYTKKDCEILSMKAFKGLPKESKLFKDHCGSYQITHDRTYCQKALNTLILTGSRKIVTARHGEEAFTCFTQKDLKSFLKK